MATEVRVRTTVLPGGRVEITDPSLLAGDDVEVVISSPSPSPSIEVRDVSRSSVLEIAKSLNGHRMFRTAEEVDAHVRA